MLVAGLEVVENLSLASLKRALVRLCSYTGDPSAMGKNLDATRETLHFTRLPHRYAYEDATPLMNFELELTFSLKLILNVQVYLEIETDEEEVERALTHLLRRHHASVYEIFPEGVEEYAHWTIRLLVEKRGRRVGDVCRLALETIDILGALGTGGNFDPGSLWDLLQSGRLDILVGQSESSTLEVKSQGYGLKTEAGKIELGQDVARFANAEEGGLLLLGFRTRRKSGQEIIEKATPLRGLGRNAAQRHRAAIDQRVYPPVEGLEVAAIYLPDDEQIIAIRVPPQPEELKPFIVHGAIAGGKVEGAFISIVRRRNEGSIPISGPAIHAWLSAGRALMRAGRLPKNTE
ncbi:hypothetical protein [Micromonospora sp. NPDC048063]|uniref:hypothetical protein n=1 Tax=Micromonospora sp. NPDC048063 TaxID=3364256 RepID=UPI0037111752